MDLPYFDRIIQKFMFMEHYPDRLMKIGLRHQGWDDQPENDTYAFDLKGKDEKISRNFEDMNDYNFIIPRGTVLTVRGIPDDTYCFIMDCLFQLNGYKTKIRRYKDDRKIMLKVINKEKLIRGYNIFKDWTMLFISFFIEKISDDTINDDEKDWLTHLMRLVMDGNADVNDAQNFNLYSKMYEGIPEAVRMNKIVEMSTRVQVIRDDEHHVGFKELVNFYTKESDKYGDIKRWRCNRDKNDGKVWPRL